MDKRVILIIFISLVLLISIQGCSRPFIENQLLFGAEAARKDLWDEAIFRWKKVVTSNPQNAAAHNNLGVAYEKKGLWDEARKEYEMALKLNPNNKYIKSNYQNFKNHYDLRKKEEKKDEKN